MVWQVARRARAALKAHGQVLRHVLWHVLRHVLWHVLRHVLRRALRMLVLYVSPKGKRGRQIACVRRGFRRWNKRIV